jgi:hypothetical protein
MEGFSRNVCYSFSDLLSIAVFKISKNELYAELQTLLVIFQTYEIMGRLRNMEKSLFVLWDKLNGEWKKLYKMTYSVSLIFV